jgi:DeoR/GlpR family transcriptional regulator of sugar metabolism
LEGTYESAVATFRIKQILADQAVGNALLVDHTKFGRRALSKVLDISQIQYVVTDDQAPGEDISYLENANIQVIRASTGKAEGRSHVTKADS